MYVFIFFCNHVVTDTESTCYFFDVTPNAFAEALDRFAQFFIAPLFTADCAQREMKAVHSEHSKNLQDDMWRLLEMCYLHVGGYQLVKTTGNPKHPFSKFGTGNLDTLNQPQIRDALIEFHGKYYSAHVMKLVVLSKEPISVMQQMVTEMFDKIEKKPLHETAPHDQVYYATVPFQSETQQMKKLFQIQCVKDLHDMTLVFPVNNFPEKDMYLKKPFGYVSYLLQNESPGSICSLLKQMGLIHGMQAAMGFTFTNQGLYNIDLTLTEQGESVWEQVVHLILHYVKFVISKAGVQEWIYKERQSLLLAEFLYMGKLNPIQITPACASNMQKYDNQHILSGKVLLFNYDQQAIEQSMDLINADNMYILHMSKTFDDTIFAQENIANASREKWYETPFICSDISAEQIEAWKQPFSNFDMVPAEVVESFKLPEPNPFIPTNFDLKPAKIDADTAPIVLDNNDPYMICYFKQDVTFKQPKVCLLFEITMPCGFSTPQNFLLASLYSRMLEEGLSEFTFSCAAAGSVFKVVLEYSQLTIILTGFDEKIGDMVQIVCEAFKNVDLKQEMFDFVKERLTRDLANQLMDQPFIAAMEQANIFFTSPVFSTKDYLLALEPLSLDQLRNFVPLWMQTMKMTCLIHGNATQEEAIQLCQEKVKKALINAQTCALLPSQEPTLRVVQLQDKTDYIVPMPVPNPEDTNSAVEIAYQIGIECARTEVLLDLFVQITATPLHENLRTKEQIGYIVFNKKRIDHNVLTYSNYLQSQDKTCAHMVQRSDYYMHSLLTDLLPNLQNDEFAHHKHSLLQSYLEKDKQLLDEAARMWLEISKQTFAYDKRMLWKIVQ